MIKLLLLCFVGVVSSRSSLGYYDLELADNYFQEFIIEYAKEYQSDEERDMRFEIFKKKLEDINTRNSLSDHVPFGINEFADMSIEEFQEQYLGLANVNDRLNCVIRPTVKTVSAPESLDWRDENKVTRVWQQGHCGSCWTFSAVGALEGQYAMKHNNLVEFSKQQLVDCDEKDRACDGGWMSNAILYFQKNGAITEEDYPYQGEKQQCKYDESRVVANVTGCHQHVPQDEDELKQILFETGPLSIGVNAIDFSMYSGGILDQCSVGYINHGVVLVGYGKENNVPYWIMKNSWGTEFGEDGYVRVKMYENSCNMTELIVSAVVE